MSSSSGLTPKPAEAVAVRRATVVTHGKPPTIGPALERIGAVAREAGVELVYPDEEREKHDLASGRADPGSADVAVVLGGDGTMLRALQRFLGTNIPVLGVNFGRVGFLASIPADQLEPGLARVFAGDYRVFELPTLEVEVGALRRAAVNDVVAKSAILGRMVELGWSIGGEDLGSQPCDGIICSTPSGSTAYNLSAGGPVLVWGLDAMAISFLAPHSLHARALVIPRGRDLAIRNVTQDVGVTVLVDGHAMTELAPGGEFAIRLGEQRTMLGSLPESTFFTRYRQIFGS